MKEFKISYNGEVNPIKVTSSAVLLDVSVRGVGVRLPLVYQYAHHNNPVCCHPPPLNKFSTYLTIFTFNTRLSSMSIQFQNVLGKQWKFSLLSNYRIQSNLTQSKYRTKRRKLWLPVLGHMTFITTKNEWTYSADLSLQFWLGNRNYMYMYNYWQENICRQYWLDYNNNPHPRRVTVIIFSVCLCVVY